VRVISERGGTIFVDNLGVRVQAQRKVQVVEQVVQRQYSVFHGPVLITAVIRIVTYFTSAALERVPCTPATVH